jgi:PKD repeat protein
MCFIQHSIQAQVCTPTTTKNCCNTGISRFKIGNQLNDSVPFNVNQVYYNQYDSVSASLNTGSSYTLTVTTRSYYSAVCVWIDWDKNDTFEFGEIAMCKTKVNPLDSVVGKIIPTFCDDSFRVRVLVAYYLDYVNGVTSFDPCLCKSAGTVTDYKIYTNKSSSLDVVAASLNTNPILNYGTNSLSFNIFNSSGTTIDSVRVGYSVNGGGVVTENLSNLNLSSCNSYSHTFSNTFNAGSGSYFIKAWANYPNGVSPDYKPRNDTVEMYASAPLSGIYTIDQSQATGGTNYKYFHDAANALLTFGVRGHVQFNISAGTYIDSFALSTISGASDTSTITFHGSSAGKTYLKAYKSDIVYMYATSYITFRNINFVSACGASCSPCAIKMEAGSSYNTIDSCSFKNIYANNYGYGIYINCTNIIYAYKANYTNITNCNFQNLYFGISFTGGFGQIIPPQKSNRLVINDNTFDSTVQNCVYINSIDSVDLKWNKMYASSQTLKLVLSTSSTIENNTLINTSTGISNFYGYVLENCRIVNNSFLSVGAKSAQNVRLNISRVNSFYHNTCLSLGSSCIPMEFEDGHSNNVKNNIFASVADTLVFKANTVNLFTNLDYNGYHNHSGVNGLIAINTDRYDTYAQMKGQNGLNDNSTDQNPNLVSLYNLHLKSNVESAYGDPAVDVLTDIDGDARCTLAQSIGADESKYIGKKPLSNFIMADTGYANSPVQFVNLGKFNQGKQFEWYIDTITVPSINLNESYIFTQTGSYQVKLRTFNCFGSHDTTKTIIIINPPTAPVVNFTADKFSIDANETIRLNDLSKVGPASWSWSILGGSGLGPGNDYDYINSTTSGSQNPELIFYISGYYDVCLTATNIAGSSTLCKSKYIKIHDPVLMCKNGFSSSELGSLYDEGGKLNNYPYAQQKSCDFLINPCKGPVTLNFTLMNIDTNNASLVIYDGINDKGKVISPGGVYQAPSSYTAKSGAIYIKWSTRYNTAPGWKATWTTAQGMQGIPSADFIAEDTGYINSYHHFALKYYKQGIQYDWDFDNDGVADITGSMKEVDWFFPAAGTYPVTVVATNCSGVDTFTFDVLIVSPGQSPNPVAFVVDNSNGLACKLTPQSEYHVRVNEQVTLLDRSEGATSWDYSVTAGGNNYTWDNGSQIRNPAISFTTKGSYSIQLTASNAAGSNSVTYNNIIKVVDKQCTPSTVGDQVNFGIVSFTFKNIVTTSTVAATYTDFSAVPANPMACVEAGMKYPIIIHRGSNKKTAKYGIWIDYNQDGDFLDAGEQIRISSASSKITFIDTVKIPTLSSNVLWGKTILRVGVTDDIATFNVCGSTNGRGEFEDYAIYITDDNTPPEIYLTGQNPDTTGLKIVYIDPGAFAIDDIDGSVGTTSLDNINTQVLGNYWVKYMAHDQAGNEALPIYRTVFVGGDKMPPVITLVGTNPYYQEVYTAYSEPGATAYDSVDGVINTITITGNVNTNFIGTYILTYTATDNKGNTASITRTIYVRDLTPPVISLVGADTINISINTSYTEPGFSASDNYDKIVTAMASKSHVDSSVNSFTEIIYSATDSSGNKGSKSRWVQVGDKTPPVITLVGGDTIYIEVKSVFTDPGYVITDNASTGLTAAVTGSVNTSIIGTNYLYYFTSDYAGNSTLKTRVVIVRKTTKPKIIIKGFDNVNLLTNQLYTDPGVSIIDLFYSESDLLPLLTTGGTFSNPPTSTGSYYSWYHVIDPAGNSADTVFRNFNITLGIKEPATNGSIIVYPNPANQELYISSTEPIQSIQVFDLSGKVVYTDLNFHQTQKPLPIYVGKLSNGMYIVKLSLNEILVERKIVINR